MMRTTPPHQTSIYHVTNLYTNDFEIDISDEWFAIIAHAAKKMVELKNLWDVDTYLTGMLEFDQGNRVLGLTGIMLRDSVLPKLELGREASERLINASSKTTTRMAEITEKMLAENKSAHAIMQELQSLQVNTMFLPHYISMSEGIANANKNLAVIANKLAAFNYNAKRMPEQVNKVYVTQIAGIFNQPTQNATDESNSNTLSSVDCNAHDLEQANSHRLSPT